MSIFEEYGAFKKKKKKNRILFLLSPLIFDVPYNNNVKTSEMLNM